VWGDATWDVSPDVELRVGARASYFEPKGSARLAPRLSAIWHVDENAHLRIAAGRFFQVVRGPESILSSDLTGPTLGGSRRPIPDDPQSVPGSDLLALAGATHLVIGLEDQLDNGIGIGLEGHFKSFDGLPGAKNLYSSGTDVWVQAENSRVRGWIGYSLAWVWTSDASVDTRFVGRQLLSGGLATDARGFDIETRLTYGAGLPFTNVATTPGITGTTSANGEGLPPAALSGAPDDSYLRIDAKISRRLVGTIGDSRLEIAPYVHLLNGLERRDALFYRTAADGPSRPVPLASIPVLAVFGIAWRF